VLINGSCARSKAIIAQLIRRIANDHVELHIASKKLAYASLDVVGVNERIGVGLQTLATVKGLLACAAVLAIATNPHVLGALEPDIAVVAAEGLGDGVLAFGVL